MAVSTFKGAVDINGNPVPVPVWNDGETPEKITLADTNPTTAWVIPWECIAITADGDITYNIDPTTPDAAGKGYPLWAKTTTQWFGVKGKSLQLLGAAGTNIYVYPLG